MKVTKRTWKNKDGSTGCSWSVDFIDNTKKRVVKSGFKTKAQAENYLAKVRIEIDKGSYVYKNTQVMFTAIVENFMNNYANSYCRLNTILGYRGYLKNHLIPYFEKYKAVEITPNVIRDYIKYMQDKGLKAKTINHTINLLSGIFNKAIEGNFLNYNPVTSVKRLKLPHMEMEFLDTFDIKALLTTAKENYPTFYPLLQTAIATGMRRGELLALTWNDIDFDRKLIRVNKSLNHGRAEETKTKNSVRNVAIPENLISVLKDWKQKAPKSHIIFCNSTGGYIDPNNMAKRFFKPCLKLAGVKDIRFHDLRHTYASLMISKHIPIKFIQQQMGHSSIQVTLDKYGHLMPELYEIGGNAMNDVVI